MGPRSREFATSLLAKIRNHATYRTRILNIPVGEAEDIVEGDVEQQLPPHEPVNGTSPPEEELQEEAAKGLAGREALTAVGQSHGQSRRTD